LLTNFAGVSLGRSGYLGLGSWAGRICAASVNAQRSDFVTSLMYPNAIGLAKLPVEAMNDFFYCAFRGDAT